MDNLTVSQEFLLCILNEKGKMPAFKTTPSVCLMASGVLDLIFANCISIDEDKKVKITGELPQEYQHLISLYQFIIEIKKTKKASELALDFSFTFGDKNTKELFGDVGTSLANKQCVIEEEEKGVFGSFIVFIPKAEAVDRVVQKIRAELLEDGVVSMDIIALLSLLEKSNYIKKYFSPYEKNQIKARIKEIKDTTTNLLVKKMIDAVDTMIAMIAIIATM